MWLTRSQILLTVALHELWNVMNTWSRILVVLVMGDFIPF
jgi:hypothetical protein